MTNTTLRYKALVDRTLRFLGLACIAGMSFALQAETRTFVGSAGGAWGTADNWNPSGVPAATDTAVVPADTSVRVTSTDIASFLAVTDVSLSGTVELLDVTATLTETQLSGTGTFRALGTSSTARTVTFNSDNSAFQGTFFVSNVAMKVSSPAAIGSQKRDTGANASVTFFAGETKSRMTLTGAGWWRSRPDAVSKRSRRRMASR